MSKLAKFFITKLLRKKFAFFPFDLPLSKAKLYLLAKIGFYFNKVEIKAKVSKTKLNFV